MEDIDGICREVYWPLPESRVMELDFGAMFSGSIFIFFFLDKLEKWCYIAVKQTIISQNSSERSFQ